MGLSRAWRRLLAVAIGLGVVLAGALLVSAIADEPSKIVRASTRISAPQRDVWQAVADVEAYAVWNPTIVSVEGRLEKGSTLAIRVRDGDGNLESREVRVLDVNGPRKFRWQDRLLLPGVRDRELTIRVRWLDPGHSLVIAAERYEGLLAPLADTDDEEVGLQRLVEALRVRAEG
jgi:hypothetical protein